MQSQLSPISHIGSILALPSIFHYGCSLVDLDWISPNPLSELIKRAQIGMDRIHGFSSSNPNRTNLIKKNGLVWIWPIGSNTFAFKKTQIREKGEQGRKGGGSGVAFGGLCEESEKPPRVTSDQGG